MKILILTNFYPPHSRGGYDQWCYEISELLKERGHHVTVATSNFGVNGAPLSEDDVHRVLRLDADFYHYRPLDYWQERPQRELEDIQSLSTIVESCQPDIAFVWGMWNFSRTLPYHLEQGYNFPVVYFISDHWPADPDAHEAYWQMPAGRWYMKIPKWITSSAVKTHRKMNGHPLSLRFDRAMVVSQAMLDSLRTHGVVFADATVLRGGTDVEPLLVRGRDLTSIPSSDSPVKLLYAGAVEAHKGVHTAIDALALLAGNYTPEELCLSIIGSGSPAYAHYLERLIEENALQPYIHRYPWVDRTEMPTMMGKHDVLLFTSIYEEPFARMVLEGMAAGLTVIGTTTGGSKEILEDGVNALTFDAGNADDLAACISRLLKERQLAHQLAKTGRELVVERYTLHRMVDDIEAVLTATRS